MSKIVIVGASGAIGAALVNAYGRPDNHIYALSRLNKATASQNITPLHIDLLDQQSIAMACDQLPLDIDRLIVATGILHGDDFTPEKSIRQLQWDAMAHLMMLNAIAPMMVAKHCVAKMAKKTPTVMGFLSARVGSISDNRLGGWYSYRASKAALNMGIKTLSLELKRSLPQCAVVGLHPGTVDSNLSQPFQKNVPEGKLFTPAFSADKLQSVVEKLFHRRLRNNLRLGWPTDSLLMLYQAPIEVRERLRFASAQLKVAWGDGSMAEGP